MKRKTAPSPPAASTGRWVRSSRCNTHNNCVELKRGDDSVGVRDSKNTNAGALEFDHDQWQAFLTQFMR